MTKALPKAKAAPSVAAASSRLIGPKELPTLGIHYSISHLRRMWMSDPPQFPKPVYPSNRRFAWPIEVLEEWIATRVGSKPKPADKPAP